MLLLPAIAFTFLAALLYGRVLRGPFVFDDANIGSSPLLQVTRLGEITNILTAKSIPRRIGNVTFGLSFYLGRLDPTGYHLVSVALHVANALLLLALVFRLLRLIRPREEGRAPFAAAAAGVAVWFVHPVQTQAVSYVYQRFTVLCAFFYLAALLAFLAAREKTGVRAGVLYGLAGACTLLALGTKENAATLPVFMLLLAAAAGHDAPLPRRRVVWGAIVAVAALAAVAAFYLGPRALPMIAADAARRGYTPGERVLTEWRVILYYVSLLLWPHPSRLNLDYDFAVSRSLLSPPTTIVAGATLLAALAFAGRTWRSHRLLSLSIVWFLGQLAIESSFVPLDLVHEHRLYLPSSVPLALAGAALWRRLPQGTVRLASFALLLGSLGAWTAQRNELWREPVRLLEDTAVKSPEKARVHGNLGHAYQKAGQVEAARRELERALALDPELSGAANDLAVLYLGPLRDSERAAALLDDVLRRHPDDVSARVNRGVWLLRLGRNAEAEAELRQALVQDPVHPAGLYNLAAVHFNRKEWPLAIEVLRRAVSLWPAEARLHGLLGAACLEAGDLAGAEPALRQALELDPAEATARLYWPKLLAKRAPGAA